MTRSERTTWWLILAALVCICCGVARAESLPELDRKIRLQEQRCQTLYLDALQEHSDWIGMYNDWAHGWPRMHDPQAYARLIQKQWRKYDKAQMLWLRETAKLVGLYDKHRAMTREGP